MLSVFNVYSGCSSNISLSQRLLGHEGVPQSHLQ